MIAVRSDALGTRDDRGKDFATFVLICAYFCLGEALGAMSAPEQQKQPQVAIWNVDLP